MANGPNIFQMLLVVEADILRVSEAVISRHVHISIWIPDAYYATNTAVYFFGIL